MRCRRKQTEPKEMFTYPGVVVNCRPVSTEGMDRGAKLREYRARPSLMNRGAGGVGDYPAFQGLRMSTPVPSKSDTFRVTSVMPWTSAVPPMSPSRTGRGSGT